MKKSNLVKDIALCFKASRIEAFIVVLIMLISGIAPTVLILLETEFVDTALSIMKSQARISGIIPVMISITTVIGLQWFLDVINNILNVRILANVREYINSSIIRKKLKLEYSCFENPEVYYLLQRTSDRIEHKITNAFFELLMLMKLILVTGGLITLLYRFIGIFTFVIVAVITPLFLISIKSGRENFNATKEVNSHKKNVTYLNSLLCGKEASLERSLYHYEEELSRRWNAEYEKMMRILIKTQARWFFKMKAGASVIAVMTFFITLFLLKPLAENQITIGMFTALVNAGYRLINKLSWEITEVLDRLIKNCSYMQDLEAFFELKELSEVQTKDGERHGQEGAPLIEFKNVSFRYPGAEKETLTHVSFQIRSGMHCAFIGENGSGKTTITKLLLGLFPEYKGEIFIEGRELRTLTQKEISHWFSVVFQDYAQYEIGVDENMMLAAPELGEKELLANMREVFEKLGIGKMIDSLPDGLNTKLGKLEADSVGISQGQWQKIAIARSLMKHAGIYILDEPGSALDPVSEVKLYEDYYQIMEGKTVISISHRLGCLKKYDKIFLMSAGHIVDSGSHLELLDKSGLYQEMYEKQRRWYSYE